MKAPDVAIGVLTPELAGLLWRSIAEELVSDVPTCSACL